MGHSIKRKEDPRFIRGQGRYVDDIQLPGMLYLDIVRSPFAHAKITKIDTERALKVPGVLAVITGRDARQVQPALDADADVGHPDGAAHREGDVPGAGSGRRSSPPTAMPPPTASTRWRSTTTRCRSSWTRSRRSSPARRCCAPTRRTRRTTTSSTGRWATGRRPTRRSPAPTSPSKQDIYLPRIHVASIETCGCVADFDRVTGKLTVYMTTQAPHAIRTVVALVAGHVGLSEEKIRIVSPDIGGGFGGKVPVYPGYVIAIAASVVVGKPVKWIEDRMENLQADSFARDYHIKAELAAKKDGTITALRIKTIADHGYADAAANPSKFPAGLFSICTGSYDVPACVRRSRRGVYQQAAGRHRVSLLVPRDRGRSRHRADGRRPRAETEDGSRRAALQELHAGRPLSLQVGARLGVRQRQLCRRAAEGDGQDRLRGAAPGTGREAEARRADGHRHLQLHRDRRRRALEALRHPRHQDVRFVRAARAPDRQGDRPVRDEVTGAGARNHLRADHRRGTGHSRCAHPVEEGDTDTAPYGLGTYASRSTPVAGAAAAIAARKVRDKAKKIAAHLLEVGRGGSRVGDRPSSS